jgi:hypothetical protein
VPADVTFALTAKRITDVQALLQQLLDARAGLDGQDDAKAMSEESRENLGFDIFSADSLASIGIDADQGVAIWGTDLNPTLAVALSDPTKLETFVDAQRDKGVSIQSQMDDKIEVFTIRNGSSGVSWAVVDGWVLMHVHGAIQKETGPELAWLDGARAANGAFAGGPDFAAAMSDAKAHATAITTSDGPPIVGIVHPGPILDIAEQFIGPPCTTPFRSVTRLSLIGGAGSAGPEMTVVANGADGLAPMILAAAPGWYGVRNGAPLQLDVGLDVGAVMQKIGRCIPMDRKMSDLGLRTVHVAAHEFAGGIPSKAGAYVDLVDDRGVRALLDQIPLLSHFSNHRKVGSDDVEDVSIPMVPDFSYSLTTKRGVAAVGSGVIDAILSGQGTAPAGELFHLDVHPNQVPDDAWNLIFENVLDVHSDEHEATLAALKKWDDIALDATLDQDELVITLSGTRHH